MEWIAFILWVVICSHASSSWGWGGWTAAIFAAVCVGALAGILKWLCNALLGQSDGNYSPPQVGDCIDGTYITAIYEDENGNSVTEVSFTPPDQNTSGNSRESAWGTAAKFAAGAAVGYGIAKIFQKDEPKIKE